MDKLRQWPRTAVREMASTCLACGDKTTMVGRDEWFFNTNFREIGIVRTYCPFCAETLKAAGKVELVYRGAAS